MTTILKPGVTQYLCSIDVRFGFSLISLDVSLEIEMYDICLVYRKVMELPSKNV